MKLERRLTEHLAEEFQEQRALIDALTGVKTYLTSVSFKLEETSFSISVLFQKSLVKSNISLLVIAKFSPF